MKIYKLVKVEKELHKKIKSTAALIDMDIQEYVNDALVEKLERAQNVGT